MFFFGLVVASAWAQSDEQPKFPRYNFNVGGGLGIGQGVVANFVGNSFQATGGAGMNFNRIFGFSGEYMYYNLNLRPYVRNSQNLPNATGSMSSASLNGLVRSPYHLGRFGTYGIFGVGFFRRTETTHQFLQVGTICQPAYVWWDVYCTGNPLSVQNPAGVTLSSFSKIAGGYNYGGGITYNLNRWHRAKVYAEWRHQKAYHSDVQTVVWPVTVGLRW
jgi:Outer membrane protein beta-barrel domain